MSHGFFSKWGQNMIRSFLETRYVFIIRLLLILWTNFHTVFLICDLVHKPPDWCCCLCLRSQSSVSLVINLLHTSDRLWNWNRANIVETFPFTVQWNTFAFFTFSFLYQSKNKACKSSTYEQHNFMYAYVIHAEVGGPLISSANRQSAKRTHSSEYTIWYCKWQNNVKRGSQVRYLMYRYEM